MVGHGGSGPDSPHPMNSMAAVARAMSNGADGVELDVQLTGDNVLVCYHDERLESLTTCSGLVNASQRSDLYACEYREGKSFGGLMDLKTISMALDTNSSLVLDCKLFSAGEEWTRYLDDFAAAVLRYPSTITVPLNIAVECQVTEFLDRFPSDGPLSTFYYAKDFDDGLATAMAKSYDGITISADLISAEQVAAAQGHGLRVAVFGISKASDAAHLGADILEVDLP